MNFHFLSLFRKPAHTQVRYVVATAPERRKADDRAAATRAALERIVASVPPDVRRSAQLRALTEKRGRG